MMNSTYQAIQAYLASHLNESLQMHRAMVDVNSFTANAAGVNALGEMTAGFFARLGFQAEAIPSVNPQYGKHLFLHRPTAGGQTIDLALVSHLDTVFPPEEEIANDFIWRQEEDRIYGPGTVDIKGGTVVIYMLLDALRQFAPEVFENTGWWVCLDGSEEALSTDFAALCLERLPESTRACLVFEGGTITPGESPLVTARKGRATFRVEVEGKSAHAGNYHAQGANAILQMAHTVQKIAALTDYKRQITFNVGTVSGGSVVNRVPHRAQAGVEMRAFDSGIFQAGVKRMLALNGSGEIASAGGFHCQVHVEAGEQTAPWPRNPGTEGLFELWRQAGEQVGLHVTREERGGLSDGNLLWQRFPTLDGLGPDGENAHCSERSEDKTPEYVLASSFVPKALLNIVAIMKLVEQS